MDFNMKIFLFILTLFIFIKTLYYGIYEIKQNNNKTSGIVVIALSIICLIVPNILVNFNINISS